MPDYMLKQHLVSQPMKPTSANHVQDNRLASNILQKKSAVLQKMAVMAVDNYDDQEDSLVWDNLHFAVSEVGAPVGDLTSHKVWDQAKDGEKIRIIEHGERGEVGGKSATVIANSMFNSGKVIPPKTKIDRVDFQSCYAGSGKSSLISEMAQELTNAGFSGVPVSGRTGIAFGFKGMGEKTARDDHSAYVFNDINAKKCAKINKAKEFGLKAFIDAMFVNKNAQTKHTNVDVFENKSPPTYNPPWVLIGKTKMEWDSMKQKERRRLVSSNLTDYWTSIDSFMKSKNAFKSLDKEKKEVISA